jgi:hypothetical protein
MKSDDERGGEVATGAYRTILISVGLWTKKIFVYTSRYERKKSYPVFFFLKSGLSFRNPNQARRNFRWVQETPTVATHNQIEALLSVSRRKNVKQSYS